MFGQRGKGPGREGIRKGWDVREKNQGPVFSKTDVRERKSIEKQMMERDQTASLEGVEEGGNKGKWSVLSSKARKTVNEGT